MLRDLKGLHDAGPDTEQWAAKIACLLLWARDAAAAARAAGQAALDPAVLDQLTARYRQAAAEGLRGSRFRRGAARPGRRPPRPPAPAL